MTRPATTSCRASHSLDGARPRRPSRVLGLVVAACAVVGCAGPIAVGRQAYEESRYLEAVEWLGAHEPDLAGMTLHDQAEYGVYRGLALLHVGERSAAGRWLAFAHAIEAGRPGTLAGPERSLLDQGWKALGPDGERPGSGSQIR